jgi:hypothetical protein
MTRLTTSLFTGTMILLFGIIAMNMVWETAIAGRIYHCTDDASLGFFTPGNWVHDPVVHVQTIDTHRPMSEPDVILAGWSQAKLWTTWSAMALWVAIAPLTVLPRYLRRSSGNYSPPISD